MLLTCELLACKVTDDCVGYTSFFQLDMLTQLNKCEVIVIATKLVLNRLPMQRLVVHFEVIIF